MSDDAAAAVLSAIERRELRSLVWGYVDGTVSESEVRSLSRESAPGVDPDGVIALLLDRGLLLGAGVDADGDRFRTRFAETARLLVRLRQLMPWNTWDTAPQLVADYRIDARPRLYAPRVVTGNAALEALGQTRRWDPFRADLLSRVCGALNLGLSRFQLESARLVHDWIEGNRGVVITAGTGSGKTLAYYLPVLVEIAALSRPNEYWVKSLSVYPRVELLKDQFSEVVRLAVGAGFSGAASGRSLRLGALYGGTPKSPSALGEPARSRTTWRRVGSGLACPFLRCATKDCSGDMVWSDADRTKSREVLECTVCHWAVGKGGELALSRESLQARPPDLLFTTAEMVNQRLSDPGLRAILGVTPRRDTRALFLLLDEIHTYSGVLGAQIATVVRRWRHAIGRPVLIAGLSATLRDAPDFFADLTGLPASAIHQVSPREDDVAETGMAYQLVLRAEASSRTSVLSTTIQSAFLLARMLDSSDPAVGLRSAGTFGSKLFAFTDTLDVTNRLFDDLGDAERGANGRPLASLRSPGDKDKAARKAAGQCWDAPELLHGSLLHPLRVSRTSSQDSGVDPRSDVIVATASLEVGYNDPAVGAVIQHRAPRDHATFLQRRGRAGRSLEMRPWMVTVLSEYGRDRAAFQSYELLMDPVLERLRLPIDNRYVQRIQAVHAFFDWMSVQLPDIGWVWGVVDGPKQPDWLANAGRALALLDQLLAGDAHLNDSLRRHLQAALQLGPEALDGVLYSPPRSLMLEAIPTLRRRLATNWQTPPSGEDLAVAWHPLPDFVPTALFADLTLPEVRVLVPDVPSEYTETFMPAEQMLRELAPGRVSRRFAVRDARPFRAGRPPLSHWIPVPLPDDQVADITVNLAEWMEQGEAIGDVEIDGTVLPCFRPSRARLQTVPESVPASSYAALDWRIRIDVGRAGVELPLPVGAGATSVFGGLALFSHSLRSPATVFRFAARGTGSVSPTKKTPERRYSYTLSVGDSRPAAIGMSLEVDALRARLRMPTPEQLRELTGAGGSARQLSEYFRWRMSTDPGVAAIANKFEVQWVSDACLLAVVDEAVAGQGGRAEVIARVLGDLHSNLLAAIRLLMQAGSAPERQPDESADASAPRMEQDLAALIDQPQFLDHISRLLADLGSDTPELYVAWQRTQFVEAAAGALGEAVTEFLPGQAGADILTVDVVDGDEPELWITETTLGGGGVIEAIARGLAEDPWRFARAFEAAIAPGEGEVTSESLAHVVAALSGSETVRRSAQNLRRAISHSGRAAAQVDLNQHLASAGIPVDRSLAVAMSQRLMRADADQTVDEVIRDLDAVRREMAARLEFTLDHRLMVLVLATRGALAARWMTVLTRLRGSRPSPAQAAAVLAGILWPEPDQARRNSLEFYSPYTGTSHPDPLMLRSLTKSVVPRVDLADGDVAARASVALMSAGVVELVAVGGELSALAAAVRTLLVRPQAFEFLRLYPVLAGIRQEASMLIARLEIRELA